MADPLTCLWAELINGDVTVNLKEYILLFLQHCKGTLAKYGSRNLKCHKSPVKETWLDGFEKSKKNTYLSVTNGKATKSI